MKKGEMRYREIFVPGEELDADGLKGGFGTYERLGKVYASCLGFVRTHSRAGYLNLVPIRGKYSPRVGDKVVGRVVDTSPVSWTVDVCAAYPAQLHSNETAWRVDYGETGKYMVPGDAILAQVSGIDDQRRTFLTMNQPGMKLLKEGRIISVPSTHVPRIIGRGGEIINILKRGTNTWIFVGQNGMIWIGGESSDIENAVEAIGTIVDASSGKGLAQELEARLAEKYGREGV